MCEEGRREGEREGGREGGREGRREEGGREGGRGQKSPQTVKHIWLSTRQVHHKLPGYFIALCIQEEHVPHNDCIIECETSLVQHVHA